MAVAINKLNPRINIPYDDTILSIQGSTPSMVHCDLLDRNNKQICIQKKEYIYDVEPDTHSDGDSNSATADDSTSSTNDDDSNSATVDDSTKDDDGDFEYPILNVNIDPNKNNYKNNSKVYINNMKDYINSKKYYLNKFNESYI